MIPAKKSHFFIIIMAKVFTLFSLMDCRASNEGAFTQKPVLTKEVSRRHKQDFKFQKHLK